jgi:hypothetical protein
MKLDFRSAEFIANPYPHYARLRAQAPVHALAPHIWLVTSYRDTDAVLRDPRLGKQWFSSMSHRYGRDVSAEPAFQLVNRFMLLMNPPEHTRLRGLVSKAFSVRLAGELRHLAQTIAENLVDGWIERGRVDFVEAFNYPLTVQIICAMLDVELSHSLEFQAETSALVKVFELTPLNAEELAAANTAALRFEAFFRTVCRERRHQPGNDLVSLLLKAEEGGDRLGEEEIIANIVLLFLAGHETTANMLGNALALLFQHPEQLVQLRAEPSLLSRAVEECLRCETSVQIAARMALEPLEWRGMPIAAGDAVYLALGAANRDPEVFEEPDRFRIDRPETTAKALAFGGGAHYCLGARLARIELETALEILFRRLPNLNIEIPPDGLQWKNTFSIRGLESLHGTW